MIWRDGSSWERRFFNIVIRAWIILDKTDPQASVSFSQKLSPPPQCHVAPAQLLAGVDGGWEDLNGMWKKKKKTASRFERHVPQWCKKTVSKVTPWRFLFDNLLRWLRSLKSFSMKWNCSFIYFLFQMSFLKVSKIYKSHYSKHRELTWRVYVFYAAVICAIGVGLHLEPGAGWERLANPTPSPMEV